MKIEIHKYILVVFAIIISSNQAKTQIITTYINSGLMNCSGITSDAFGNLFVTSNGTLEEKLIIAK